MEVQFSINHMTKKRILTKGKHIVIHQLYEIWHETDYTHKNDSKKPNEKSCRNKKCVINSADTIHRILR